MSWGMVTLRLSLYASSAEQLPCSLSKERRGRPVREGAAARRSGRRKHEGE